MAGAGRLATRRSPRPQRRRHAGTRRRRLADQRTQRILAAGRHPAPEAETLAAKPGFRERLDPARDYLHASRTRENDRIEAEKQRQQAELQAAQRHAAALRKRSRILVTVLAVTVIVAVVAVILGLQANHAQKQADTRFREATSLRLVSEAPSMLAGARSGGEVRAYQQLVVARRLAQTPDDGPLLDVLPKMVNLIKIIPASDWVTEGCSARMGGASSPVVPTRRCGCGTRAPASRSARR